MSVVVPSYYKATGRVSSTYEHEMERGEPTLNSQSIVIEISLNPRDKWSTSVRRLTKYLYSAFQLEALKLLRVHLGHPPYSPVFTTLEY